MAVRSLIPAIFGAVLLACIFNTVSAIEPAPFTYLGCYASGDASNTTDVRALPDKLTALLSNSTIEQCASRAYAQAYIYFGLKSYGQCWAGNNLTLATSFGEVATSCSQPCAGNKTQKCGGASAFSLYQLPPNPPSPPTPPTSPNAPPAPIYYKYLGCYGDSGVRALPVSLNGQRQNVSSCARLAAANGLRYFGLQYLGQCFGGNNYTMAVAFGLAKDGCNLPCISNHNDTCGDAWQNSLYQLVPTAEASYTTPSSPPPPPSAASTKCGTRWGGVPGYGTNCWHQWWSTNYVETVLSCPPGHFFTGFTRVFGVFPYTSYLGNDGDVVVQVAFTCSDGTKMGPYPAQPRTHDVYQPKYITEEFQSAVGFSAFNGTVGCTAENVSMVPTGAPSPPDMTISCADRSASISSIRLAHSLCVNNFAICECVVPGAQPSPSADADKPSPSADADKPPPPPKKKKSPPPKKKRSPPPPKKGPKSL